MGKLSVGVAGWDYRDWNGIVYPAGSANRMDRLAFISRYVDAIEVNSTFYRPVAPRVAESWVRRTLPREGFRFTAKAHRTWTHERGDVTRDLVRPTLEGLAPIREAGQLGALLLQFPQSVHFTPDAMERLQRLVDLLGGWPLVVEVRHVSWNVDEAFDWLAENGVGWCAVDQPRVGRSTLEPVSRVTSRVAYLRLHGRNAADWFRPDAGRDRRYDYLYSADELEGLAETARGLSESAEETFVVQNNHFRGQALVNTLQLMRLLAGRTPAAPQDLVATYPALEPQVDVTRDRLF
ncbi:MAG: DUF72 domain-containing protein [bacterium]|nr:DUF72 domain-containing protein [bacterium]